MLGMPVSLFFGLSLKLIWVSELIQKEMRERVVGSISVGREGERGGKRGEFARSCELKRKQGTEHRACFEVIYSRLNMTISNEGMPSASKTALAAFLPKAAMKLLRGLRAPRIILPMGVLPRCFNTILMSSGMAFETKFFANSIAPTMPAPMPATPAPASAVEPTATAPAARATPVLAAS